MVTPGECPVGNASHQDRAQPHVGAASPRTSALDLRHGAVAAEPRPPVPRSERPDLPARESRERQATARNDILGNPARPCPQSPLPAAQGECRSWLGDGGAAMR